MLLVLARFLFGFGVTLSAAAILLAATAVCLAFVRRTLHAEADERRQDVSNGVAILITVVLILLGCFLAGHLLYDLLGSALAGSMPHWLAGDGRISAAALLGAIAALGLLAYLPRLLRPRQEPDPAAKPATAAAASRSSAKTAKPAKPAKAASAEPGPRRMAWLGWTGLLLALIGVTLLVFAYIVTPPDLRALLMRNIDTLPARQAEMIAHARFIFYVAGGTLLAGALLLLAWPLVRRPAPA
ncbi:hypothetical protein [Bordetella petrii]|uniref:hypothetical protein n=1 Tax=Bordetella petrii TaxID=94624 RepID=UPI0037346A98